MSASTNTSDLSSVVQISSVIGASTIEGSGILIAPNLVLTAAHIVWETGTGVGSNIHVTASVQSPNGSIDTENSTAQIVGFNPVNDANDYELISTSVSDFALLYLTTPIENVGTFTLEGDYTGGQVNVTGYPTSDGGNQVTAQETVSQDSRYSLLLGNAFLGAGSSGGPLWYTTPTGSMVAVGLVNGFNGTDTTNVKLTTSDLDEISQWESTIPTLSDSPTVDLFTLVDTTQNNALTPITVDSYDGPLSFLTHEDAFSYNGVDNVQVSAEEATDPLIATGSGDDLITGSVTGSSVLDGGTNANIETDGGNGNTTFVQNGYDAGTTWDFLQNFHGGDEDIIFGYIPNFSKITLEQSGGMASDWGATVTVDPGNGNLEEATFVGVSLSSLQGCSATIDGVPSFILWSK